jgi:hypothetical protein
MRDVKLAQQIVQLELERAGIVFVKLENGPYVICHGKTPEDRGFLGKVAQATLRARVNRHAGKPLAIEIELAAIRGYEPYHHVKAGCFSRPVRPEKADNLAAMDLERHVFHDDAGAVALAEVLDSKLRAMCGLLLGNELK